ncbi:hypothetical protein GEV33_008202 [Tenebrio molitor]|uniref:Uncharacterized protein n=1 Tax=Tenebrio molitor TaxID=7067 RepID=A0A8J6HH81_TENMO|nr:hypothetical protein GEV33_008202 [Tenebrio molitor]
MNKLGENDAGDADSDTEDPEQLLNEWLGELHTLTGLCTFQNEIDADEKWTSRDRFSYAFARGASPAPSTSGHLLSVCTRELAESALATASTKGPEGNICGDTFANVSINDNRNELAIRRLLQWTTGDAGSGPRICKMSSTGRRGRDCASNPAIRDSLCPLSSLAASGFVSSPDNRTAVRLTRLIAVGNEASSRTQIRKSKAGDKDRPLRPTISVFIDNVIKFE